MKRTIFSLIAVCSIVTLVLININDSDEESLEDDERLSQILDKIWIEYDVLAYSVLTTDSVLYFVIDDQEDKGEVTKSIKMKLEQNNIEGYSLEIYKEFEVAVK